MSDGYNEMAKSREHWDAKRDAEIERLRAELAKYTDQPDAAPCKHCSEAQDACSKTTSDACGYGQCCRVCDHSTTDQQTTPQPTACVCGEPQNPGITHRTDGPCYVTPDQQTTPQPTAALCVGCEEREQK
jgi:hypothetical protein